MATKRRVIGIMRHGLTPNGPDGLSLDSLTDESVQRMYEQGLEFRAVAGESAKAEKAFVLHSDKERTITTAKARLAGIRKITPAPLRQEDLEKFKFNGVLFIRDDRLSYENLELNYDAIEKMGLSEYAEWMLANRNATEMEGKPVTSFQQIYDTRKAVLGDTVRRLESGRYDLGFISTHGTISDAITMAAADSAGNKPVSRYEEIGGQFDKEDIAYLVTDIKEKSGTSNARIVRGGLALPVDISRIRSEY
jgi:hypothetical protein